MFEGDLTHLVLFLREVPNLKLFPPFPDECGQASPSLGWALDTLSVAPRTRVWERSGDQLFTLSNDGWRN